jgi:hypothetical protein
LDLKFQRGRERDEATRRQGDKATRGETEARQQGDKAIRDLEIPVDPPPADGRDGSLIAGREV